MPLVLDGASARDFCVRKIGVVGPGIVGMPMAALLAHAAIREGTDEPATVVVVQRPSPTSGWKVEAINAGRSPIGGVEPDLDRVVAESVAQRRLRASHDYAELKDADLILICVQTDQKDLAPDYGPLFEALSGVARAIAERPAGNVPLVVFESTLAPSSMTTVVREFFAARGLVEGRNLLLGNSPNRVMPGRLVQRVAASDKLIGGLHPATSGLIQRVYARIVTSGTLLPTNSLTAEIVKTLENAYRDLRIAYAAEVVRFCDARGFDFYDLRQQVNERLAQTDAASSDPNAVPSGGILVPTVGVGGHCLPKDGILLLWRLLEAGVDLSRNALLAARRINDESPAATIAVAERRFGPLDGRTVALLGVAYRFNSEDTRNSPTLVLARLLVNKGCVVRLHDPYVHARDQNLARSGLQPAFTHDLCDALAEAEYAIACTAHRDYVEGRQAILAAGPRLRGLVDACNLYAVADFPEGGVAYTGIGRGAGRPDPRFVDFVLEGFVVLERGFAAQLDAVIGFLNDRYAPDDFNRVRFTEVQRLAGTMATSCVIAEPELPRTVPTYPGFEPRLLALFK